ncbi:MAG: phage major capsid protein [Rhodospirillales bacterium]|nr:phage major capsid protein [Rhodospirillales bacterium]
MNKLQELRDLRSKIIGEARDLAALDKPTDEQRARIDEIIAEADRLAEEITRLEKVERLAASMGQVAQRAVTNATSVNINRLALGDTEERAFAHFVRTGDGGGLAELRASNDTTMNITTAADGGYAVPTGHYQGIIARRDEGMLATKLGVRRIPGKGTSVNIPVDGEDDGEFVSTAESSAFDRDAPAIGQVVSTLVKYTKKVDLTVELLNDEDSALMAFLDDFVGRGMAKTHNSLLLTEVAANGTSLKTFASATVIAVDELEPITFNEALSNYLDDGGSVAWVMQRAVHGEIVLLDDANTRRYANNQMGNEMGPTLLGFPVHYTAKAGATAASAKSVYFGNWNYVGLREGPGITVLRDPYSRAGYGEVILHYYFRCDYNVLQAEAIGYGVHPSA